MPINELSLLGAGGHAKVVCDAVFGDAIIAMYDDDVALKGKFLLGYVVNVPIGDITAVRQPVHVAVGDNRARKRLGEAVMEAGKRLHTVIHRCAVVSAHALIADGVFIAARAVVAPDASIGRGAIINHGAVVDHDCEVEAWAHIAPNAVLGGDVRIGEGCLIGSGAVVLPGVSVGEWAVVGAGAVVTKPVPARATTVGVPAVDRCR